MTGQFTAVRPAAAMPPPITPPTMECVVETGAPSLEARLSHSAAASSAAIIAHTLVWVSASASGATMPPRTVPVTLPPAISAPRNSNAADMISASPSGMTPAPTVGPILLATSLAPMFRAI